MTALEMLTGFCKNNKFNIIVLCVNKFGSGRPYFHIADEHTEV